MNQGFENKHEQYSPSLAIALVRIRHFLMKRSGVNLKVRGQSIGDDAIDVPPRGCISGLRRCSYLRTGGCEIVNECNSVVN
jgi:hypothetical protein